MTATTAETTAAATSPEVLEGEIVDGTAGPSTEAPEAPATETAEAPKPKRRASSKGKAAGEEKSSGEVVPAPRKAKEVEKSALTKSQATKLAERIRKDLNGAADLGSRMNASMEEAVKLMAEAWTAKIWLAFDQGSWDDFVDNELGDVRLRLDRTVRQSFVFQLAQNEQMSQRAIAPIFGVDQKTVGNDLRAVRRELNIEAPTKVTGRDGKEQSVAAPKARKAKPVEERVEDVLTKLDSVVGDLTALSVEEAFGEAAGTIAKSARPALARALDSLTGVLNRLQ